MKKSNKLLLPILAVLTLGLAPYFPEPHFFGKLRWILGGGAGMQATDYFDLLMHGAPWLFLIYRLTQVLLKSQKKQKS
jgi:hypothetical protein